MNKSLMALGFAFAVCAAFADMKIGTVDMMVLVKGHSSYEPNKTLLTERQKDYDAKLDRMKGELEEIQKEGTKLAEQMQSPILAASAKSKLEQDIVAVQKKYVARQQEMRSEMMRAQQDLQDLESKLLKITTDDIRAKIDAFAEANGYDLVIDKTAAAYAKPALEVTEAILKTLNTPLAKKEEKTE